MIVYWSLCTFVQIVIYNNQNFEELLAAEGTNLVWPQQEKQLFLKRKPRSVTPIKVSIKDAVATVISAWGVFIYWKKSKRTPGFSSEKRYFCFSPE